MLQQQRFVLEKGLAGALMRLLQTSGIIVAPGARGITPSMRVSESHF
jgi:hypothetical protein